jgi:Fur family ferric uptake transcriptional regulator
MPGRLAERGDIAPAHVANGCSQGRIARRGGRARRCVGRQPGQQRQQDQGEADAVHRARITYPATSTSSARQILALGDRVPMTRKIDIESLCAEKGLRITEQRRVIARVLSEAEDHPDVEALHARAAAIDPGISIATVYRTVRLFEEAGILERHDFGDGRARYEAADATHHDHLIDVETGNVIEFVDDELEALQRKIAEKLGFRLVDHRMELYGVALGRKN